VDQGLLVLLVVLVATSAFGLQRRRTDGRLRRAEPAGSTTEPGTTAAAAPFRQGELTAALGERATLVQFSSAFCQPCRAARAVLADVARSHPGIVHVEVDAESHLDLVRRLGVRRTPTVLVLDAAGHELGRAVGVPRRDAVLAALAAIA
jgi:thioredoxin-like negative regulator of GroEL